MLVSVIIPCYNALPYLKETLDSLKKQSYKKFEIIIVDDGSTDGSFEYLKSLRWDNLKLIKNKGKGACAARNNGFELSSGDYIQFLDADDILSPTKIEAQINLLDGLGMSTISSCKWGRFHNELEDTIWENKIINRDYTNPLNWLIDSWNGKGVAQTSVWLTPRHLIEQSGGWNEELLINQDGEYFARVLSLAKEIKYCKNVGVYYRSGNPNSISNKNKKELPKAKSLLKSYCLYKEYILKNHNTLLLREALGNNFLSFMYHFHSSFPELTIKAQEEFYDLGFKNMWPVGGQNFKTLSRVIGFANAIRFRSLFSKTKSYITIW